LLPRFSGAKKERIPASVEGTKAKLLLNKKSSRQKIRRLLLHILKDPEKLRNRRKADLFSSGLCYSSES